MNWLELKKMENSQIIISLNNNELITWYGVKRPYHVIIMVWAKLKGYTMFRNTLTINHLSHGMPIPCKLYHVCIERGMAPPIYIGGPSHTTFLF